jgi:cell wall-associated NlpC family hydrolase
MFVLDGAKARIAALTLAAATAVPLFPNAKADVQPLKAAPVVLETKAPKKTNSKKKKAIAVEPKKADRPKLLARPVLAFGPKPVLPTIDRTLLKEKALKLVLETARKQLGKPYRYGATGPSSFDCSGFTSYVWRKVGVHVPRTSGAQYSALPHVPRSKARLGDIVYSPGHVGLYIGDGKMIHSPHSGRHVEVAPLHSNVVGFARPALS